MRLSAIPVTVSLAAVAVTVGGGGGASVTPFGMTPARAEQASTIISRETLTTFRIAIFPFGF